MLQTRGVGSGGQAGPTAPVLTSERRSAFGSDCLPYGKTPYRRLACRAAEQPASETRFRREAVFSVRNYSATS